MVEPTADGAVAKATEALTASGEGDAPVGQVDVGELQAPIAPVGQRSAARATMTRQAGSVASCSTA
ncbi:hypothetical protein [Nocardia sp. NPDC004260]